MQYQLHRREFKKKVIRYFKANRPEYLNDLNSNRYALLFAFLDGFIACINVMGEDPIRNRDVDDLLLTESVKFLVNNIENM